ncbi:MAG TPA: sulfite exporter TauE/SafE family protein [Pyrinomonadaceae bacterium]|nr:sulfite exporter TauE/SafE family protein [Pyrinomonadaceae bacterium]HMP66018.1 sulfite exporter TauE/SafE family protein [Pyrinomonadaceae bacterium]
MEILAYIFAAAIGISLGLIGAGGSILTVPVLVYMAGVDPVLATAYSLFVVGSTALVGGVQNTFRRLVDIKTAILFGIPSIVAVYSTRAWILPSIPAELSLWSLAVSKGTGILLLFAALMVATSLSMIRGPGKANELLEAGKTTHSHHYGLVLLEGIGVGVLTGLVGAGGGFLIIPALVLLAGLEMKVAIGTSLFIIAMKSLLGFTGDIHAGVEIDWPFLLLFTASSVSGIFIGTWLTKFIDGYRLKRGFGWFVLVMGIYMIFRETLLT